MPETLSEQDRKTLLQQVGDFLIKKYPKPTTSQQEKQDFDNNLSKLGLSDPSQQYNFLIIATSSNTKDEELDKKDKKLDKKDEEKISNEFLEAAIKCSIVEFKELDEDKVKYLKVLSEDGSTIDYHRIRRQLQLLDETQLTQLALVDSGKGVIEYLYNAKINRKNSVKEEIKTILGLQLEVNDDNQLADAVTKLQDKEDKKNKKNKKKLANLLVKIIKEDMIQDLSTTDKELLQDVAKGEKVGILAALILKAGLLDGEEKQKTEVGKYVFQLLALIAMSETGERVLNSKENKTINDSLQSLLGDKKGEAYEETYDPEAKKAKKIYGAGAKLRMYDIIIGGKEKKPLEDFLAELVPNDGFKNFLELFRQKKVSPLDLLKEGSIDITRRLVDVALKKKDKPSPCCFCPSWLQQLFCVESSNPERH